jgi:hypothetical protein
VTHEQATELPEPGKGALDDPAPPVTTQLAPVLVGRVGVIAGRRDDGFDPPSLEPPTQWIAVVTTIEDQPLGAPARPPRVVRPPDPDRGERGFEQRDLRGTGRVQVCSQRSTLAIDQYHPLRSLAPLGFTDSEPPFFAAAKLPSPKHSSQRTFCRSLSSARKARHSANRVPSCDHWRSRRQQVTPLPYSCGTWLHWAPVHSTQRMPVKHLRSSTAGRPPFGHAGRRGR